MNKSVGFLGLGIMGNGMCHNLLKHEFPLSVWNRSQDPVDSFKDTPADICTSPAEVAGKSEILMSCLTNYDAVKECLFGESGAFTGEFQTKLYVGLETIAPAEAKELAERLAEISVGYIDAPVSGGDIGAKNGTLTVMAGASQENYEIAFPAFHAIGQRIFHTGEVGSGQATKAVNQVAVSLTIASMTEAILLANGLGLNLEQTIEVISSGAAGSWSLSNYAPRLLDDDLTPGFKAAHMLKDLRIALNAASKSGVSLPSTELVTEMYQKLCETDGDTLGNHALIRAYKK